MTDLQFYILLALICLISVGLSMLAKAVKDLAEIVKTLAKDVWK